MPEFPSQIVRYLRHGVIPQWLPSSRPVFILAKQDVSLTRVASQVVHSEIVPSLLNSSDVPLNPALMY